MNRRDYAAQIHSAANALGMSGAPYEEVAALLEHIAGDLRAAAQPEPADAEQNTETG